MKTSIPFISLLLFFSPVIAQDEQAVINEKEQIEVYNALFEDLFNIGECRRFITPPFYACCNYNEHMAVEDHVACCEESSILPQYKIYCQDCINIGELDTLELVMEVIDTLYPLDFEEYRDYILDELDTTTGSEFYHFISSSFFNHSKIPFDKNNLHYTATEVIIQNKDDKAKDFSREKVAPHEIDFMLRSEINELEKKTAYGKKGNRLFLGKIDLSLVYFNEKGNLAFFYFAYLGHGTCGGLKVCLTEKVNDSWQIVQEIDLGSF